jgi:hypothetical protein
MYGFTVPAFFILVTFVIYLFYVILNFRSQTASYLSHIKKADTIHVLIKKMCTGAPGLRWDLECYNYSTGKTKRRITHRESKNFQYFTWRDISGALLLDSHHGKSFIKLELNFEIEFADEITKYDYQMQKDLFYNMNKKRDTYCSVTETKELQDYNQFNFVKISDESPCGVNYYLFVLFTVFIPVVELYKIYVNSCYIEQKLNIKKVVSTRYNLNEQAHAQQWLDRQPKFSFYGQLQVEFNDTPQPCLQSPGLPSEDELQRAREFCNKFPNQIIGNIGLDYVPYFSHDLKQPQINNSEHSPLYIQNVN